MFDRCSTLLKVEEFSIKLIRILTRQFKQHGNATNIISSYL